MIKRCYIILTHDYPFEAQQEGISMEIQCLHAWEKTIICYFENVKSTVPPWVPPLYFSWHFPYFPYFCFLCSSGGKNKCCKCSCAWLNWKERTLSFSYVSISQETYLTSVPQCPASTSRSWMGPFSPWKHLNGDGSTGPISCHSSKVCQEFNGVSWSVKVYRGSAVSSAREQSDSNALKTLTHSRERKLHLLRRDILWCLAQISRVLRTLLQKLPERRRRV